MSAISLRLPDSLHRSVRELAAREHVSINQMMTLAIAEKISALWAEDYIQNRAKRGSKAKFKKILSKVPNRRPDPWDKI